MRNVLTCFGVGEGWPCADRGHASFLYRFGKKTILIDCGEPVDSRLKASGIGYDAIDAAFISHMHADHFGGLFMLMQGFWLEERRKALRIHMPGGAIRPLRAMLKAAFIFDEMLSFQLELNALQARQSVRVGSVRLTPFPTTHLASLRRRFQKQHRVDYNSYAFLIESGSVRIGHSADLGHPEDLAPLIKEPLDLLVCELSHFLPEDLFDYLKGRDIGKIVFVHLSRACWQSLGEVRRLAARSLKTIPHTFAKDGDVIGF